MKCDLDLNSTHHGGRRGLIALRIKHRHVRLRLGRAVRAVLEHRCTCRYLYCWELYDVLVPKLLILLFYLRAWPCVVIPIQNLVSLRALMPLTNAISRMRQSVPRLHLVDPEMNSNSLMVLAFCPEQWRVGVMIIISTFTIIALVFVDVVVLEVLPADSEAQQESNERNPTKETEGKRLAFRLHFGCRREDGTGNEGSNCSTSR